MEFDFSWSVVISNSPFSSSSFFFSFLLLLQVSALQKTWFLGCFHPKEPLKSDFPKFLGSEAFNNNFGLKMGLNEPRPTQHPNGRVSCLDMSRSNMEKLSSTSRRHSCMSQHHYSSLFSFSLPRAITFSSELQIEQSWSSWKA